MTIMYKYSLLYLWRAQKIYLNQKMNLIENVYRAVIGMWFNKIQL